LVGFTKADVEGHAFAVVRGASETLMQDHPIFSFSSYHEFSEMSNASKYLMDLLPHYRFEWHMENGATGNFPNYRSSAGRNRNGKGNAINGLHLLSMHCKWYSETKDYQLATVQEIVFGYD
jgi:hypothetical protein